VKLLRFEKRENFSIIDLNLNEHKLGGHTDRIIDNDLNLLVFGKKEMRVKGEIVAIDVDSFMPGLDLRMMFVKNRNGRKLLDTNLKDESNLVVYNKNVRGYWVSAHDPFFMKGI
jgi:hypothetical protein